MMEVVQAKIFQISIKSLCFWTAVVLCSKYTISHATPKKQEFSLKGLVCVTVRGSTIDFKPK